MISPNVVLLLPEDASCHLHRNDYAIGSLAWSNASLGLGVGVVSAMVGSNGGWIVTLFNTIDKSDVNSSLLEWTFRRGGCWFELQDQLGFNQSEFVIRRNYYSGFHSSLVESIECYALFYCKLGLF